MTRLILPMIGLTCAGLLSACGGNNYSAPATPAVTDAVPDSASQSSAGLVTYLTALAAADADDKEPLDLGTFNPVRPDDSEPEPVT
jgi:hypothetical protein